MKKKHLMQFAIGIIAIVIFNYVAQQFFFRIDLTEEQRYSISKASKNILKDLDDEIYIKIYLEGDLPSNYRRLKKSIQETLDEFKIYAGKKIKYQFINPSRAKSEEERKKKYSELVQKGIPYTTLTVTEDGKRVDRLIFPGALLYYKKYEASALLLKTANPNAKGAGLDEIIRQSIENSEFNLISAIRKLTIKKKKRVGFIEGHGELSNIEMAHALESASEFFEVYKIDLPKEKQIKGIDAIVVAKPDSAFSEQDKYKIDQYVMKGGKALFFMDGVGIYMDSVIRNQGAFTFPYEHNLLDMFFKYGVRINNNLIKDLNAGPIPIVTGQVADGQPRIENIPWTYHPLINTFGKHPIAKNLGIVQSLFVTTMDTVKATGIRKTPLLLTSQYSKTVATPALVKYDEERQKPRREEYSKGSLPIAYLLEGRFTSLFKSKSLSKRKGFREKSKPTKVLICSDGDLIRNEVHFKTRQPLPIGVNAFGSQVVPVSNIDFFLNALDFLIDDKGIISARNKEIKLRPLDKFKVRESRTYWQVLNMALPIVLVVIFGIIFFFLRKYRFER